MEALEADVDHENHENGQSGPCQEVKLLGQPGPLCVSQRDPQKLNMHALTSVVTGVVGKNSSLMAWLQARLVCPREHELQL